MRAAQEWRLLRQPLPIRLSTTWLVSGKSVRRGSRYILARRDDTGSTEVWCPSFITTLGRFERRLGSP
jgi:hypothetical protein